MIAGKKKDEKAQKMYFNLFSGPFLSF